MENGTKLLLITGGTKGIGKAIIEKFASQGFIIATCSRSESDLKELKREIEEKYKVKVYVRQTDLSEEDQVRELVDFVRLLGKKVDVLVNNAGRFIPGQVHTEEAGVLEEMIHTNLYSAYHLTRGIVPDMLKRGSGHIFNICSTASITAYTNGGSYCISKFALYGMSKVLREELKPHGIRVTSVLPGATFTASWEGAPIEEDRFMKSEDVAEMVYATYALSPNSVVEDILIRPQLGDI